MFDTSLRVKDANAAAISLTGGSARPDAASPTAPPETHDLRGTRRDPEPGRSISYCSVVDSASKPQAVLINFERADADLVLRLEPLGWSMEFSDLVDECVFVTGSDGYAVYANSALRQRVGWSPDDVVGEPPVRILDGFGLAPAVAQEMMAEALRGVPLRHEWVTAGAQSCLRTAPLRYCGCICGVVWSVHESYRVVSRDVHQLAALSYRISTTFQHELGNTLQTMHAALAVARLKDDGGNARLLTTMESSLRQMTELLSNHAFRATPCPGPLVKLTELVGWAIADARRRHTSHLLSFEHLTPEGEPELHLDRFAVRKVFAHIFVNAAQANPRAHVRVSYSQGPCTLDCTVEDDGPGFPSEALAGLATTRDPSTHLGLPLVVGTVEAHGGFVQLSNAPRGGAVVRLSFPLRAPVPSAPGSVARNTTVLSPG